MPSVSPWLSGSRSRENSSVHKRKKGEIHSIKENRVDGLLDGRLSGPAKLLLEHSLIAGRGAYFVWLSGVDRQSLVRTALGEYQAGVT